MASPPDLKQEQSSPPQQPPSSPPMATPLSLLIPVTTVPTTVSRRLPPPCWTPDETSALIDSYRDKWYSLRRGNLRAAHWQDVADDIHRRCPAVVPPKTAVQCRHKMEKLRKRYRAELNRAKSIPHHRFSSSWVYFSKMESMEKGPNNNANVNGVVVSLSSPPPVSAIVAASQDLNGMNMVEDDDDDDEDEDDDGGDDGGGFGVRNFEQKRDFGGRDYGRNGLRIKIAGNSGFRENPNPNSSYGVGGYRSKYASINNFSNPAFQSNQFEDGGRYGGARVMKNVNGMNMSMNINMGGSMNVNNNNDNGMMRNVMMKKEKEKGKVRGMLGKREREERENGGGDEGAVAMEMVEAIRMLGEGFVRMEKMKMEMMRETERMRMEMEMKRTEMILESQHRIVEAFAKGWADTMNVNNDKDGSC